MTSLQLIPGPVSIPKSIREAYLLEFGSSDIEPTFHDDYARVCGKLARVLETGENDDIVLLMGEGMLALWAALKSVTWPESPTRPASKVLALATGVYGYGIGEMAQQIGCNVEYVGLNYDDVFEERDMASIVARLDAFQPDLVTLVHCETPSGTLNYRLESIGAAVRAHAPRALFYVDCVSSGGGAAVRVGAAHVDLALLGSQKALSCAPSISIVAISERAWHVIEQRQYCGYDALAPWRVVVRQRALLPYTFDWNALAALDRALDLLLTEGLANVYARHARVAQHCRDGLRRLGLRTLAKNDDASSPTVTAFWLADDVNFASFDAHVRSKGVALGGSYGKLEGRVARIGHMGAQATIENVDRALAAIESFLTSRTTTTTMQ